MSIATTIPQRITLRRTKGWKMPAGTVVVTRHHGSPWGNPFKIVNAENPKHPFRVIWCGKGGSRPDLSSGLEAR